MSDSITSNLEIARMTTAPVTTTDEWTFVLNRQNFTLTDIRFTEDGLDSARIVGDLTFGDVILDASVEIAADDEPVVLRAGLHGATNLTLNQLATILGRLANASLELPEFMHDIGLGHLDLTLMFESGEFEIQGTTADEWIIPVGVNQIEIEDGRLTMNHPGRDSDDPVTGTIAGRLPLGSASFDVTATFPGDVVLGGEIPVVSLSLLLQEFCGGEVLRHVGLPISILQTDLRDVSFSITPQQHHASFAGTSLMGQSEITIKQADDDSWMFNLGFKPPETWEFSTLDPNLKSLNDLNFAGTTLIAASSSHDAAALRTIAIPHDEAVVQKGLNLFASLDIQELGLDAVLPGFEVDQLQVYAAIGSDPRKMVIEAGIAGAFAIDEVTSFGDITFRLKPSPTNFELLLAGTVTTILDDSPLAFVGGLGIVGPPPAGRFQASMVGTWNNPFGTRNLAIRDVALDLGTPPLQMGLTGGFDIGDFSGRAAVSFNAANPAESALIIEFNRLGLDDIFDAFCPPHVRDGIPRELTSTILDVDFEDVSIYLVPQPTTIGEQSFDQGISLRARMNFWGLSGRGLLTIDQTSGILVIGELDPVTVGEIFKLTGANGRPNAHLLTDLRLGQPTQIDITAAVELLGMARDVEISVNDSGFSFATAARLFDLFEATLLVRGSDMVNGDGIFVQATMKNDLFAFLQDRATRAIAAAAKEATEEITQSQRAVSSAQADVNKLNSSISAMRRTVQAERERDARRLRQAQNAVKGAQSKVGTLDQQISNMRRTIQQERSRDSARLQKARADVKREQNKVNQLKRQIDDMRRTVQAERNRDTANLRRAEQDVATAQSKVNAIQRDINSAKSRINTLNNQIKAKKRWLDGKAWYDKAWAGPEYAAYAAAKRAEQGALYTKIGTYEAAKHTALGVLEVAKRTLRGMQQAAKTFPIDADPRVAALIAAHRTASATLSAVRGVLHGIERGIKTFPVDADPRMAGLFTARATSLGALSTAQAALKGIQSGIKAFPIDADPRIVGLFTARDTATAALEAAKFTLEGVKQATKGMAEISQFIVDGVGQLLVVHAATFESALSAAHGGEVALALDLTFMGERHNLGLDFDFHDPATSITGLVEQLLPS